MHLVQLQHKITLLMVINVATVLYIYNGKLAENLSSILLCAAFTVFVSFFVVHAVNEIDKLWQQISRRRVVRSESHLAH